MDSDSITKQDALQRISDLAKTHSLTLDEIGACLTIKATDQKGSSWFVPLLGYLGAAFIFAGLGLFIEMIWFDLASFSRVVVTYGSGLVVFMLGALFLRDPRYIKASTPLFLVSSVLLPMGMFVFLTEYSDGNDEQLASMFVFGVLACQFLCTFYFLQRTNLLFFGYLFWNASLGILMERSGVSGEFIGIGLGLSIMMVTWVIDRTHHRAIAPFWYFLGSMGLLWSVFDLIEGIKIIDLLYLPLTILMMLLSTRIQSRTLLLVSTLYLLGFLGYFTYEYFADVSGWPIALIVMGFMLVAVSAYAVKLARRMGNEKVAP
jgi:hypothetical protein